jgi:hypothetical protein
VLQDDSRHIDGALMVRDHAAREVRVGVAREGDVHVAVHLVVHILERFCDRVAAGGGLGGRAMSRM